MLTLLVQLAWKKTQDSKLDSQLHPRHTTFAACFMEDLGSWLCLASMKDQGFFQG